MSTLKIVMTAALIVVEVLAAIFLVCKWIKAKREQKGRDTPNGR